MYFVRVYKVHFTQQKLHKIINKMTIEDCANINYNY